MLRPESSRVIIRPFIPGNAQRITTVIGRALALSEEAAARIWRPSCKSSPPGIWTSSRTSSPITRKYCPTFLRKALFPPRGGS